MWIKSAPVILFLLSGCSVMTTEAKITTKDYLKFQFDCNDNSQEEFLKSQRVSEVERAKSGFILSSWLGFASAINDGTYEERRSVLNGERATAERITEYNRQKVCPPK